MNASLLFYFSGIEKQAGKIVYKALKINRHELNMLVGLSAYLMIYDRKIISRHGFVEWLGLNYGLERRCFAYLKGLIDKGALHRLAYRRPDGNCLAISGYGARVLECFEMAINKVAKENRPILKSYKGIMLDITNLPQGYTLMQQGRTA